LPNFGVTDERRETIDHVTYINDGQGFATRKDSKLSQVTDLRQLCGLNIATGAGTTFEATLEDNRHLCTDAGEQAYKVQTYNEQGAIWSSLQQGRSDVVMSTINGLRNRLIADGTYDRILKKWGTTGSAITKSEISPPEPKD
jgi:polar amino acid transport system substrate-binding protein